MKRFFNKYGIFLKWWLIFVLNCAASVTLFTTGMIDKINKADKKESVEPTATYYWHKDGLNYTREFESGFSDPKTRSKKEKAYLVKDIDSKGDSIIYPED